MTTPGTYFHTFPLPPGKEIKEIVDTLDIPSKARNSLRRLLVRLEKEKEKYKPLPFSAMYENLTRFSGVTNCLFLAMRNNSAVGVMTYGQIGSGFDSHGHLLDLFVASRARGQDVGTELFGYALAHARKALPFAFMERSVTMIIPMKNEALANFLLKTGFQPDMRGVGKESLFRFDLASVQNFSP